MIEAARVAQALADRHITADPRQREAIDALVQLYAPRPAHAGVYCYGLPGRGKSLVVDTAFAVATGEKRRVHFHEFLREMHRSLVREPKCDDRLAAVANRWLAGVELLCFDEFHVHDIADAFLIGRFLEIALSLGVRMVLTSNYAPEGLFPDPEFHARFEPTIAVIVKHFAVVHFDGKRDYRMGGEAAASERWLSPLTAARQPMLAAWHRFEAHVPATLSGDAAGRHGLANTTLAGRPLAATAYGEHALWASFDALCVASRSHLDYLALAERWQALLLDELHVADLQRPDTLQRFLWLVDICYDRRLTLFIASDEPLIPALDALKDMRDLSRTISRLCEMGSLAYEQAEAGAAS